MSFGAGLSGVAAANSDLSITGNNIANASTTGFKTSRAEFGDVYSTSMLGAGQDAIGAGVSLVNVGQKFDQGNITQTGSVLDLAIEGTGFFITEYPNNTVTYTRSGIFGVDTQGYIVSNNGAVLQGYGADENGIVSGILTDLQVNTSNQAPQGTQEVLTRLNMPAGAPILQSEGTITRTNGIAIGVAQVGPEDATRTTLTSFGVPRTAGTPAELVGGISRIAFPWQPSSVQSSWSLDVTLVGANIDTPTNSVTSTIQPFSDTVVYGDVNDLVASINASINSDPNISGKIQATVNSFGGISFETFGTYAADGTSIVSIADNVGSLSTEDYLNFVDPTVILQGTAPAGLEVVSASTQTTLTSGRNATTIDNVGNFLDSEAGETIDFIASVDGLNQTVSVTVPAGGYADYDAFATALSGAITDVTVTYAGDRFVFEADNAGDLNMYFTALSSSTSNIDFDALGISSAATFTPSTVQGIDKNNTLTLTVDGPIAATLTLSPGTYPTAELLVQEINAQIAGSALDGEVLAYEQGGVLIFDRLNNSGSANIVATSTDPGALSYYGLASPNLLATPSSISPIAGANLFDNGGFIDLSSDPGQAVTVQGNIASELTFNNIIPGSSTRVTSANTLTSLDTNLNFGSADAGNLIAFSATVAGFTESIIMTVPAGGYVDQSDFANELENELNAAFSANPSIGGDTVSVVIDSSTNQLVISAGADVGIGPQSISIADLSSTTTSTINMLTLGLSVNSVPAPTTVLGAADTPANNQLQISVDGGPYQTIVIPEGSYSGFDDLVAQINTLIYINPVLSGAITATQTNGRLVFERTEVGAYPIDIDVTGSSVALDATGLASATKTLGEAPVDRANSFRINLAVPLPDTDNRSGSVEIALDEAIYSIDQLASAINRQLASVPADEYIGVKAEVVRNANDDSILTFVATESGEASQISITNVQAQGTDLDVNSLFALLQVDPFNPDLLAIGEAGVTNGYPQQSVVLYNEVDDESTTITIDEATPASEIAAQMSSYPGITATAETTATIFSDGYVNAGSMDLYINGQVIQADTFEAMVAEINTYSATSLSSISAEYDVDTGNILLTSSIGIDMSIAIETPNDTDGLTIQGFDGTSSITLGRAVEGEKNARIGGYVDIVLNEGYTLLDPDPRVTGLFNGLTDSSFEAYTINEFDPNDSGTYNEASSLLVYDSLGNQHLLQMYYVRDPDDPDNPQKLNSWTVYAQIDGENIGDPDATLPFPDNLEPTMASFKLNFNADGTIDEENTGEFLISNWNPVDETGSPNGAFSSLNVAEGGILPITDPNTDSNFAIGFGGTTQYGGAFARYDFQQDGYSSGQLSDLEITDDGIIYARYTNGETQELGQVALASFANTEGLSPVGSTEWIENFASGTPTIGEPGTGTLGALVSSALEESTVDLSEQLVHLIIAQRNYQASAKIIETANAVTQTIINLR